MKKGVRLVIILSSWLIIMLCATSLNSFSQNTELFMKQNRKPAVAGTFYSDDPETLLSDMKAFFNNAKPRSCIAVRAIISPHAGYVFSGQTAADAFNQIDENISYSRVFVICSSHQMYFNGASVYNVGNYETPLGEIEVDTALCSKLIQENILFKFVQGAHSKEHSLEVQLPFLQYKLKSPFLLVPIVIGSNDTSEIQLIARALQPYFTPENLFVFSSDFSHYPGYEDAVKTDAETADAICSGKPSVFLNTLSKHKKSGIRNLVTDLCGWSSVLTLLYMADGKQLTYNKISYTNSGDSKFGEPGRVVGYNAIAVSDENKTFSLSDSEKKTLLQIARNTAYNKLAFGKSYNVDSLLITDALQSECGVFVSLHKNGELRGCLGRFTANEPLYKLIGEMAVASCLNDSRFSPVTASELDSLEIEISVLTPMRKITDTSEIVLGKHGVYIRSGMYSGTFLPQVATQTGWTLEEFLGHCSRDKAGIGWNGWKQAELYIYEALVFNESMFSKEHTSDNHTLFYEVLENGKVKCTLCPNYCELSNGQTGLCNARRAENNSMKALTYGKLAAVHNDPIEKKPLYHFLPQSMTYSIGTGGCNLHCKNCQNHHISQVSPEEVDYIEATPEQVVENALKRKSASISYTYNEPTVFYEFMLETAKLAREKGLKNIIVSNGYISEEALRKLIPYIDAANIDLKCFNDSVYQKMCSAHLEPVLNTLKVLRQSGVWLEITNLIIPGWSDNMVEIEQMCKWLVENG
ncbi:MAG TPA: AmmeMemoRadiSam system radical SAM enzyme, partial [Bacteroidales bacterium]|nr:AmmeMemoRadiSam system radical SAM enzyme [Bacteroidales bacterium]